MLAATSATHHASKQLEVLRMLRTLRALRPMRAASKLPGMKVGGARLGPGTLHARAGSRV
jgi:hypothetical protein